MTGVIIVVDVIYLGWTRLQNEAAQLFTLALPVRRLGTVDATYCRRASGVVLAFELDARAGEELAGEYVPVAAVARLLALGE